MNDIGVPLVTLPVTAALNVIVVPLATALTVVPTGIFALPLTKDPFGIAAVVVNVSVDPLVVVALVATIAVGLFVII